MNRDDMNTSALVAIVEQAVIYLGATQVPADETPPGVTLWRIKGRQGHWQMNALVAEALSRIAKEMFP